MLTPPPTPSRRRRWWRPIVGVLTAYALYLGGMFMLQDRFIYLPPVAADVPFDRMLARTDIELGGWVVPKAARKALVIFGGNAQALAPWRTGAGLLGCTDRTVFLLPYRGYEGNPGHPHEADLIEDARAWLNQIGTEFDDIAVWGISLGTGVATAVAAAEPTRVQHLLLGTPYDSMVNVAWDHQPWAWPSLILTERFPSVLRAAQVTAPVHVLRATADTIINAERTQRLLAGFTGTQVAETVVEGGHTSVWSTPQACAWLQAAAP